MLTRNSEVDPMTSTSTADCTTDTFDDTRIWCQDCGESLSRSCCKHAVTVIVDKLVPSRARLTLPAVCQIQKFGSEEGIAAKKFLQRRTQFGPLEAPEQKLCENIQHEYHYKIFSSSQEEPIVGLDCSDENLCNWLMFMRPAKVIEEQNIVAFQHNRHIYFTTIKSITPGCELRFWYAPNYSQRMGLPSLEHRVKKSNSILIKEGFPCEDCGEEFKQFEDLNSHVCAGEIIKDDDEGRRTRNKRKGRPQKLLQSQLPAKVQQRKRKVKSQACCHCEEVFPNNRSLTLHLYSHTGELPYKCSAITCNKAFNTKFKLSRHALTHSETREFVCSHCNKKFVRKDHLKNHLLLHDQNRTRFKCDFENCDKVYTTSVAFKTHKAMHKATAGSLECDICHNLFDCRENLTLHIKIHAGSRAAKGNAEKKFMCSMCDKRFFTQKDVRRHIVTHTKERKFVCSFCTQAFGRQDHLTRHLRRNHTSADGTTNKKTAQVSHHAADSQIDINKTTLLMSADDITPTENISHCTVTPHIADATAVDGTLSVHAADLALGDNSSLSPSSFPITSLATQNQRFVSLNSLFNGFIPINATQSSDVNTAIPISAQPISAQPTTNKPFSQNCFNLQSLNWHPVILTDNLPQSGERSCQVFSSGDNRSTDTTTLLITECNPALSTAATNDRQNILNLEQCDSGKPVLDASTSSDLTEAIKMLGNVTSGQIPHGLVCGNEQDLSHVYGQPSFTHGNNTDYRGSNMFR